MTEINYESLDLIEEKVWQPSWYHRLAIKILGSSILPKHIAIIMDGNRRWAVEHGVQVIYGHMEGIKALDKTFHWLNEFGIPEFTVYAFSPDNYKRDKNEVKQLLELLCSYLQHIVDKREAVDERGFRFMIYGDVDVLPSKLRTVSAKIMLNTRYNNKIRLNFAINYKSSDEMDTLLETLKKAVEDGDILDTDIDEVLVDKCLYSGGGKSPDLLIRTSGEKRFSDFYLWQLMRKPLFFSGGKWPEFTFFTLCKAISRFQRFFPKTNEAQKEYEEKMKRRDVFMNDADKRAKNERVKKFLEKRERLFYEHLSDIVDAK